MNPDLLHHLALETELTMPVLERGPVGGDDVDRLGWIGGIAFEAYGVRVGIRVNQLRALDLLWDRLPYGWRPISPPLVDRLYSVFLADEQATGEMSNVLYCDATTLVGTGNTDYLFDALQASMHVHVAEMSVNRVFVHAGVVGWQDQAIVIPGASGSGKSTLVAALVRAGAIYYSDEFAVLDREGLVHPFPRPLSLRDTQGSIRTYSSEALSASVASKPLPVGVVVITRFNPGAQWRPRRLTRGRAILGLLASSVAARRHPEMILSVLQAVTSNALPLKGVRGEASTTAGAILIASERAQQTRFDRMSK